jgi:hypothetical protein
MGDSFASIVTRRACFACKRAIKVLIFSQFQESIEATPFVSSAIRRKVKESLGLVPEMDFKHFFLLWPEAVCFLAGSYHQVEAGVHVS